jgi:hypothetical protein
MARSDQKKKVPAAQQKKAQAAWDRIEAIGGQGVWESDMVAVSFDGTEISDEDLSLFRDFPFIQTLDLSNTTITDKGLAHLEGLPALESLKVTGTKISAKALKAFRRAHPDVTVTDKPPPKGAVNPFTGKPL